MSTPVSVLPRPRVPRQEVPRRPVLSPSALRGLPEQAALVYDLRVVTERVLAFRAAFRNRVGVHYAVKCNPDARVLSTVAQAGGAFEIASLGELAMAADAGADPCDVLYSNPVKPPVHVAAAAAAGVRRFAVDSPEELDKIAQHAPGTGVYVRLNVDDRSSRFPLSSKFGTSHEQAARLLLAAVELGLVPEGLTFHVGSQCTDTGAWGRAVRQCVPLLQELDRAGVRLRLLDIGGGFPARYAADEQLPVLLDVGEDVLDALETLPYEVEDVVCEPGRAVVAESAVLAATVIGRAQRGGRTWVYTDVGAYNGLMEAAQTSGTLPFPVTTSRDGASGPTMRCTVTGPSCDSSDTLLSDAELPADLAVGDRVCFGSAGAYSLSYASAFNGFPIPTSLYLG